MRKALLFVVAVGIISTCLLLLYGPNVRESSPESSIIERIWTEPDVTNALTDSIESEFRFDVERLYDVAYLADPALISFAGKLQRSPECVIAIARYQIDGVRVPGGTCRDIEGRANNDSMVVLPGYYETICRTIDGEEICRRVKVSDHPYERYSDEELVALAASSPEAAVILARRLRDDSKSEEYYEQAVVLSGRPGPLEEWMFHRNLGGLVRLDGALDIGKASLGYEIYLTTARFGYGEAAAREYERLLEEAHVDTTAIQTKAAERYSRLTKKRQEILGTGWEG